MLRHHFPERTRKVVEAFADSMGVKPTPAPDGSYGFLFERSGALSITPSADGSRIILSLTRTPERPVRADLERLLALAGRDPLTNSCVHAGVTADGAQVLSIDVDERVISAQSIHAMLSKLIVLHHGLR